MKHLVNNVASILQVFIMVGVLINTFRLIRIQKRLKKGNQ